MLKSIEYTGKTPEEAVAAALAELNTTRDKVEVEVLEKGKAGLFGFGAVQAKVRVSYVVPETKAQKLEAFLKGLLEHMDVEASMTIIDEGENGLSVEFEGDNIGSLIGHRGETLDAIQHLANYSVNRNSDDHVRISVDAENYRAKREESLKRLADKVAGKVRKYHRSITLESMNAYERHVIHASLQDYDGITTYSTGTEPNRRVVVALDRPQKRPYSQQPRDRERTTYGRKRDYSERRDYSEKRDYSGKRDYSRNDDFSDYEPPQSNTTAREWA